MASSSTSSSALQQTCDFYHEVEKAHEKERKAWDQQRAGWQHERKMLFERIHQLESSLSNLMKAENVPLSERPDTQFANYSISGNSNKDSQEPRAIWQGPESIPTRTFSDSATVTKGSRQIDQLHSIAEHPEQDGRKKSVGFDLAGSAGITRHTSLAGVPGELIHPNYSGITLKGAALSPETRKRVEEAKLSPNRSPSPHSVTSPIKPEVVIRPRLLDIPTANRHSEDLYNIHAGHTPLARVIGSEGTTGTLTPVNAETDRPPLEPHPTEAVVRPPHERQDSYFVNAQIDGHHEADQDPALKEPLGVASDKPESGTNFLDKVNEALEKDIHEQVESSDTLSPNDGNSDKTHNRGLSESDDFPKLRMKASSNFGAPFGESSGH